MTGVPFKSSINTCSWTNRETKLIEETVLQSKMIVFSVNYRLHFRNIDDRLN